MKNKWTLDDVKKTALKYNTRTAFQKGSPRAYQISRKSGIHDDICKHMEVLGNLKRRMVYGYFFDDSKIFYIGLTCNHIKRHQCHCSSTNERPYSVAYVTRLNGTLPRKEVLSDGYIDVEKAIELEGKMIEYYKSLGWITLNRKKAGGLGKLDVPKWTKENCHQEALKYKHRGEFQHNSKSAYVAACYRGWLDEICSHMLPLIKPEGYWDNKEHCYLEALKYHSRSEFAYNKRHVYNMCLKNKWMDEFFPKNKTSK